jgi:hypothetical protein
LLLLRSISGWAIRVGLSLLVLSLLGWSSLAIYFSNLPGGALRTAAAWIFGAGFLLAFLILPRRRRTALCFAGAFAAVLAWWSAIPASNDRDWLPEYGRIPTATIDGSRVTIRNVRNFDYRSENDSTVRYDDRTYNLDDLQTLDFIKSQWAGPDVVHTMLSFGFRGGDHIAVSAEARRERGEPQTGLRGLFKQYELIYVLGDELDLLRLRTEFRKEDVYLYPIRAKPEAVRIVFLDIIKTVDRLAREPQFYNTLTHNCTLSLLPHLQAATGRPRERCDLRLLLNGHTDELAFERGGIDLNLPLDQARRLCHVNQYLEGYSGTEGYSQRIRTHLKNR